MIACNYIKYINLSVKRVVFGALDLTEKVIMLFRQKSSVEYIVAGLGNPGTQYEKTRHNAGYRVMDYLSQKTGIKITRVKFRGLYGKGTIKDRGVLFLKPTTFMNLSGESVAEAAKFYKVPAEKVIIIYDDISLKPGTLRIRDSGSAGGHNGIKNIILCLGTQDFPRIKVGVGERKEHSDDLVDWVLGSPSKADNELIESRYDDIMSSVELIIEGNLQLAQSRYNK